MFALPVFSQLRRTTSWVLAAWLCVLLAGIWAPVARVHINQQHVVYLCSGEVAPAHAPSPLAPDHDPRLHHVLECPLCLPMLAPPPAVVQTQTVTAGKLLQSVDFASVTQVQRATLPPARAPPLKT